MSEQCVISNYNMLVNWYEVLLCLRVLMPVRFLTIDGITISSENLAQNAITRIDAALSRIGGFRAEIGAKINAIESTIRNESNQSLMLSSANQRIEDTDFAKVMAEKISLDIVQQAGVSVAMQARNITKEGILSLLGQLE